MFIARLKHSNKIPMKHLIPRLIFSSTNMYNDLVYSPAIGRQNPLLKRQFVDLGK